MGAHKANVRRKNGKLAASQATIRKMALQSLVCICLYRAESETSVNQFTGWP
jgi:hypothetical protein